MKIIGCDLHTRYQQIAMLDSETGELVERRLEHENGEARAFYGALVGPVRVGIEATGSTAVVRGHAGARWATNCGSGMRRRCECRWCASKRRTRAMRHTLLDLLVTNRFPRIWRPSWEERDLRQLVWHRQKLVWMREAVKNQTARAGDGPGRMPEDRSCSPPKDARNWKDWYWGRGPVIGGRSCYNCWISWSNR